MLLAVTAGLAIVVRGELLRGIVIGLGVAGTIGALSHFVVIASGAGPLMMGELAEQWTAQEVRPLLQRGWHVINHFPLPRSDVDHLVMGTAGVFAVETKWSGLSWESVYARRDVDRAVWQAQRAAEELRNTDVYRALGLPPPRPLVVLWGAGAAELAEQLDRSDVLSGSELRDRLERFGLVKASLTIDQTNGAWRALSEHVSRQDKVELAEPIPPSVQAMVWRITGGLASGLVSFFLSAEIMTANTALWVRAGAIAVLGIVVHPTRRWPQLRIAATGWQAGVVATLAFVAAVAGDQILR
jgi:hypothetical protein